MTTTAQLTRDVRWVPRTDGGNTFRWIVSGPDGVVELSIVIPPKSVPYHTGLAHHWRTPTFNGEQQMDSCVRLPDEAPCFYDASYTAGDSVFHLLAAGSNDEAWHALEAHYAELVNDAKKAAAERATWWSAAHQAGIR